MAVKTTWQTFKSSVKTARDIWKIARASAWDTFKTSAKSCNAPAGIVGNANQDTDSGI